MDDGVYVLDPNPRFGSVVRRKRLDGPAPKADPCAGAMLDAGSCRYQRLAPVMSISRPQPTIRFGSIIQIAVVIGGLVAVGLLVVAHPLIGAALIVGVVVLVLLFGRAPVETMDEPPPPE